MTLSRTARWFLRGAMALGLAFVYVPLLLVLVNSFNSDRTFAWPPPRWTIEWWVRAWHSEGARAALWTSVKAGLGATAISSSVAAPSIEAGLLHQVALRLPEREFHVLRHRDRYRSRAAEALLALVTRSAANTIHKA